MLSEIDLRFMKQLGGVIFFFNEKIAHLCNSVLREDPFILVRVLI